MFAPPSKIGNAMLGANDHAAVPALNRPPSVGRGAERARQRDLREERRACRTDVRVRGQQRLLGLHHVGATRQQIRRQAGRHVRQQVLRVERHARRQIVRQRLADQQHQRVQRLRACPCLRLLVRQRLLDHCLRLTQLEPVPLSNCSFVRLYESCAVFSVFSVTFSRSSVDSSVRY